MNSVLERFDQLYPDEDSCYSLMLKLKWTNGFRCPACRHSSAYTITTRSYPLYECQSCKHQTSLTVGTIMERSRTPLKKWLLTMYIVATCENSINAANLSVLISVTYKTAWSMLTKIRQAISDLDRSILLNGSIVAKPVIYRKQLIPTSDSLDQEHAAIAARSTNMLNQSYVKVKLLPSQQHPRARLTPLAEREFMKAHVNPFSWPVDIERSYVNPFSWPIDIERSYVNPFSWPIDIDRSSVYQSSSPTVIDRNSVPQSSSSSVTDRGFVNEGDPEPSEINNVHLTSQENLSPILSKPMPTNPLSQIALTAFEWINHTFHGVSLAKSQAYLDEYCFRKNVSMRKDLCPLQCLLQGVLKQLTPLQDLPDSQITQYAS